MSSRSLSMIAASVAVSFLSNVSSVFPQEPRVLHITLEQALQEATSRNPALRARRAEVERADGRLQTAKTYPYNPELTLEGNRRTNGDSTTDRAAVLGLEIEIGRQRDRRIAEAEADLEAFRDRLIHEERLLHARVRAAFLEALRVRELLEVERANTELARSLAEVAQKRFESGAVAQMEVNLSQVQAGRARRDLRLTEGAYEVACALLAEEIGLDPTQPPEPDGELEPAPERRLPSLVEIAASARQRRADLESFRKSTEAARARIELARREAIPNLTLEAFYGEEEGTDRLVGGGFTIGIPLFNRNQGRIAEARAAYTQALAETSAAEIRVRQEVASAFAMYQAAREASRDLQRHVLSTLHENLGLLQRSFEAGKTGWTDVLVFRREFVDVQREYIETLSDAALAEIELDLAAGIVRYSNDKESQP